MIEDPEDNPTLSYVPKPQDRADQRPLAEPLPGQVRLIKEAIAEARAAGLRLPAAIHLRFVQGSGGSAKSRLADGTYRIALGVDAWPGDLLRTTYHELQHISDYFTRVADDLTYAQREQRACRFASSMLAWRETRSR